MELILFLLSFFLLACRAQSQIQLQAVLDTDGNPVISGEQYRVLPSGASNGGGLMMSAVNGTCPPHVVQHGSPQDRGEPVMFFPEEGEGSVVRQAEGLLVMFSRRPSPCPEFDLSLWTVDGDKYVTTGGDVNLEGPLDSRFAIHKDHEGRGYEIRTYCTDCVLCEILCPAVVPREVNGTRLLAAGPFDPYFVVLERVKWPATVRPDGMRSQA